MSNFRIIGDGPFGADGVSSVDGQTGAVNLTGDYAPVVHGHDADEIIEDIDHRFASDAEKAVWNGKQDALGFTPEDSANKSVANGYASLDAGGKVPVAELPATGGDVSGPASSIIDEVAVYADATGKILKTVPVTISDSGVIKNISTTEQQANAYMEQNREIVNTSDGTSAGTPRGRFGVTSASLFRIRTGSGNALVFTADVNGITALKKMFINEIKSGATQGAAGASANEVWKTSGHATLPDNVLMIGV